VSYSLSIGSPEPPALTGKLMEMKTMSIDQVIAAQEANEAAARACRISFTEFKAEESRLEKMRSSAMAAICARIAAAAKAGA